MNPVYLEIFKDSLLSNFVATVNAEFAYIIVLYFGKHNEFIATAFAFLGSVIGLSLTFALFYALALALKKILEKNPGYPQAQHYVSKFSPVFGLITVMPQVCVIPAFFFGMAKLNWKKFLLITIFYKALYYGFVIYTTQPLYN